MKVRLGWCISGNHQGSERDPECPGYALFLTRPGEDLLCDCFCHEHTAERGARP